MEYKKNRLLEQVKGLAAKIEALTLTLIHQAGEEGKLFGSVTNMELAEKLNAHGIEIDRKKILLAEPIKHLGEFTTTVKLHPEVSATLKVIIVKPE
jgi:large subunit ribosomal protein L9